MLTNTTQSRQYTKDAEYYQKKADGYRREAQYYLKITEWNQLEAAYYTKKGKNRHTQNLSTCATCAVDDYKTRCAIDILGEIDSKKS